ncbi:hypothetical protein NADFUDRAFT_52572 [Nadsonia fulvescens var. elongata DSM 6958]|uniref:Uncharacterized protein n=1 Tax=Nadsonia fulvescens var. elongata DSM 6958 TaxID=857566 RepID=A0A1E3PFZ6_9ASCO|nr:hypothetical protein NADFUDRAFT_52572 [Nadsonia fulvescens var. elongata DSM 6958]
MNTFNTVTVPPKLDYEQCVRADKLMEFLRLSRRLNDDHISGRINELVAQTRSHPEQRERISLAGENQAIQLKHAWDERDNILEYCEQQAKETLPDESVQVIKSSVDPRIDPYNARTLAVMSENEKILDWTRRERRIEEICRDNLIEAVENKWPDLGKFLR